MAVVYQPAGLGLTDHRLHDRLPMGRRFAGQDAALLLRNSVGVPAPHDFTWCATATFYDGVRSLADGATQRGIDVWGRQWRRGVNQ